MSGGPSSSSGFPSFPLAPLDPAWGLPSSSLQFNNSLKDDDDGLDGLAVAAAAALVGNVYHDDTITQQHNDHPLSSLLDITPATTLPIDVGMPNNNSLQQQQQYNGGVGGRMMMMNHPSIMSNDNKNTLHFTPHNFHQAITIHYPTPLTTDDYATRANTFSYNSNINNNNNTTNSSSSNLISLPVCTKCKKNYKTRDICRMKLEHTDVPWTNSYICITLHESCVGVDGQYVAHPNNDDGGDKESGGIYTVVVSPEHNDSMQQQKQPPPFQQQQPQQQQQQQQQQSQKKKKRQQYQVQTHFDSKTPVCSACKLSKRTMTYCRKKMRHKDLPWNTLYVMLKLGHPPPPSSVELSSTDEAVGVNNADRKQSSQQQEKKQKGRQQKQEEKEQATNKKNDLNDEFDINCIAPSRTFLAVISSEENSIRWLTRVPDKDGDDDDDGGESEQSQQNDFMSNPSFQPQSAQGDDPVFGSQVMNDDDASSSLAVDTKKKKRKRSPTTATKKATTGRRKTAATTKPTIATTKKKQKKLTKRDRKRKEENNNKRLALEAIAYAKEQARKERLQQQQQTMLHQFVRVPQPPPSLLLPQQQQHQEQQLLLPQQYQLLGTEQIGNVDEDNNNGEVAPAAEAAGVEEHLEKVNTEIDNEEDDDKMTMLGVNDSDNLDGDDILTEAAKLMEWL